MQTQNICNKCFNKVEQKIGDIFSRYGRFVAKHPWKFIILCVLVNGSLGIGMIKLRMEKDMATVYTPIDSEANQDSEKVKSSFPDLTGSKFAGSQQLPDLGRQAEVVVRTKSGNILDANVLGEVEKLHNYVTTTTTDYKRKPVNFTDICARNNLGCVVDGEFFFSSEFKSAVNNSNITYPIFYHPTFGPIYYEGIVGDSSTNGTHLSSAQMILLRFHIRTDIDSDMITAWQDKFVSRMQSFSSNAIETAYAHSDSLEKELDKNISGDITLFSVTFTLMITYACLATLTAKRNCVSQRANLGFCGVIAAGISIPASFGLVSACGVSFVSIVGMVPFLIIGIGVDDMFILLSGLAGAQGKDNVEDKIAETMRTSGVAITITSLTDLLAFCAGASSTFLSVRNFCIYTGVAVLFCYLNQATFFVACLILHEKRVEDNRHFLSCRKISTEDDLQREEKSSANIICCTGSPPKSKSDVESWLDKFPAWLFPKLVKELPSKIFILILFGAYLAVSIYGITIMKQGLELKNLVSDTSYYYKYRQWLDDNFPSHTPVSFVIYDTVNYSDYNTQNAISSLLQNAKDNYRVKDTFEINWLTAYQKLQSYDNSSEANFVINLTTQFLTDQSFQRYKNDIVVDSAKHVITASRFYILSKDLKSSLEEVELMIDMRTVAKSSSLSTFAFSPAFIFYEQYAAILPQTLQTLGVALAIVFAVTFLFMPHPLLLLYVTITVTMIIIGIFGFLPFMGLSLSSITMIHIIMSVGFSVDFTTHICHGFMMATGEKRNDRVQQALINSGAPIFHGAVSSLLGVVILLAAASYIFRSFCLVMILVIGFGIAHALLLLPVVLSFIGPHEGNGSSTVLKGKNDHPYNEDINNTDLQIGPHEGNGSSTVLKGKNDHPYEDINNTDLQISIVRDGTIDYINLHKIYDLNWE